MTESALTPKLSVLLSAQDGVKKAAGNLNLINGVRNRNYVKFISDMEPDDGIFLEHPFSFLLICSYIKLCLVYNTYFKIVAIVNVVLHYTYVYVTVPGIRA